MLTLGKQLTEEQRLSKAVVDIMPRIPEIAGLLMIGERVVTDDPSVPTACTNGRDEWYGRMFVASLNDAELRFVIIHEVFHKMYRHLVTWAHLWAICSRTANISMDYDINGKIMDEYGQDGWVKMPAGGCYNPKYKGWGTAKIFWDIYNSKAANDQPQDGRGKPQDGGQGQGGQGDGQPQDGHPEGFDSHDWDGAKDMTAEEQKDIQREVDEAIRQGSLVAGKMGSGGSRSLDELLQPKVDWREVLREFIQTTCAGSDYSTWKRPNRRYIGAGIYMPSGISEKVECIAEHNDMSGSIGKREQQIMISELVGICEAVKPDELHVSYWDTEVCGYEKYTQDELQNVASQTEPKGGGGTDVRCVPAYLREHNIKPQASIVFTDGYLYGGWGDWDHPVLWVIVDNKRAKPDHGVTVHVSSEDL
jgi:predicted metal-dependent peptidase